MKNQIIEDLIKCCSSTIRKHYKSCELQNVKKPKQGSGQVLKCVNTFRTRQGDKKKQNLDHKEAWSSSKSQGEGPLSSFSDSSLLCRFSEFGEFSAVTVSSSSFLRSEENDRGL